MAEIIEEELQPGAGVATQAEMEQDIRERSGSVFHLSGTCAMGPDPRETVVDARLRAHGLENVRIVDASIFPRLVSGNTNAASIMVGEKGAEFLLEDSR
jgi:choline dehydrogenase